MSLHLVLEWFQVPLYMEWFTVLKTYTQKGLIYLQQQQEQKENHMALYFKVEVPSLSTDEHVTANEH